jgi:hypothetical protein
MRLTSYRTFLKSIQRMRLLYEVTIHSYNVLFEQGRQRLRSKGASRDHLEFKLGESTVKRPLKIVTFHARDIYPQLLRSTLLVRLVATYEAFLVDTVEEISQRSLAPFMADGRIDMSQGQFLTLAKERNALGYVVSKKLRQLTSGGLEEIRKWYTGTVGIDLLAPGQGLADIQEIHDRRHLFVHRSGYADAQYSARYKATGIAEGELAVVDEPYFVSSMGTLQESALHLKQLVEARFPSPPVRSYIAGAVQLPMAPDCLQFILIRPKTPAGWQEFTALDTVIPIVGKLREIIVWMSNDGNELRYVIGASRQQLTALMKVIHQALKRGDIDEGHGFKIKR